METNHVIIYTDKRPHEHKAIIYMIGYYFHFKNFDTVYQLRTFCEMLGVSLIPDGEVDGGLLFRTNKVLTNAALPFWHKSDLPRGCMKVKGMSNGSVVDCYIKSTRDKVTVYRPNPNAKAVFKPMDLHNQIQYKKTHLVF